MITFNEFIDLVDHEITGSAKYLWNCYGQNARYIYSYNFTAIYDSKTLNVYTVECDLKDAPYRWIHPEYKELHEYEAESKAIDPNKAYDGVKFIDVSLEEIIEIMESQTQEVQT